MLLSKAGAGVNAGFISGEIVTSSILPNISEPEFVLRGDNTYFTRMSQD